MTSATEAETRQQLEEDLRLEAERTNQIEGKDGEIAKAEAEGGRLGAVLAATHSEVAERKAEHAALEARLYDLLIDGDTETTTLAAAKAIQGSAALLATGTGKLKHLTENRLPAQRLRVLTPMKERAVLVLDRAAIRSRVHASQLLLAVLPAGAIGGDLSIKSEMSARLAHEESQAAYDLEQANAALENELALQRKIRDARKNIGPITYTNPS